MAITASGYFGLTLEKQLIDTLGDSLEAEDQNITLVSDSATPNFDTHDFWNDLNANEVTGTNWAAGGVALTGTEITLSGGVLTFDATDVSVASTTITNAMCSVLRRTTGAAATDELFMLHDFVTAVSTSAGTFGIQWHATGLMTIDYTP
jgi:hypothetical protein